MNLDKPSARIPLLILFGAVGLAAIVSLITKHVPKSLTVHSIDVEQAHFAPNQNLETYDLTLLDTAQKRVDVAMYAFTDERLADELLKLANRGVEIRLYRDGLQLSDEASRAEKRASITPTSRIAHNPNIHIRVKANSASMHLKAYCVDGILLRTGSANWSVSGEKSQDNDLYVIREPKLVNGFEADFEELWLRSSNRDATLGSDSKGVN